MFLSLLLMYWCKFLFQKLMNFFIFFYLQDEQILEKIFNISVRCACCPHVSESVTVQLTLLVLDAEKQDDQEAKKLKKKTHFRK